MSSDHVSDDRVIHQERAPALRRARWARAAAQSVHRPAR
jgi:hypothetical protein